MLDGRRHIAITNMFAQVHSSSSASDNSLLRHVKSPAGDDRRNGLGNVSQPQMTVSYQYDPEEKQQHKKEANIV